MANPTDDTAIPKTLQKSLNPKLEALRGEIHSLWNSRSWRLFRVPRNLARRAKGEGLETEPIVVSEGEANRTIAAIHQSLSWRLTAPLRMAHAAVLGSGAASRGKSNASASQPTTESDPVKWERLEPIIKRHAASLGVSPAVHSDDHIFRFIVEHPQFDSDEARVGHYFEDGANSARQFTELLNQYCGAMGRKLQVLEFASGYGCVTRHLVLNRAIALESCDIHPAALEFLKHSIGVEAIASSRFPEELKLPHLFDFVFALSFFSHMPITTWARWLVRLTQSVRPGGAIAFTTHGMASRVLAGNPDLGPLGFWFLASSEQADLPNEEYGSTFVTETFVRKNLLSIPSVELLETRLGYWWGHQDLYVVRKLAASSRW